MNKINAKPGSFGALPIRDKIPNTNGDIRAVNKDLTDLVGSPDSVFGSVNISYNPRLTSLVGGPKEVGKFYSAESCGLTSLSGIPVKIGTNLCIDDNHLTSLAGINKLKEMNGEIYLYNCPVTSHVLGVFFIKGCYGITAYTDSSFGRASEIVNRHILKGRSGLLLCTNELIEAGLADFAQI
jgi:hypothetical protein